MPIWELDEGELPPLAPPPPFSEVAQADFITFSALAEAVGLTKGVAINETAPWLRFVSPEGKIRFMPKQSIRHTVSRTDLEAAGQVDGKIITIGNKQYRVRLPTGLTANPGNVAGGEWKELITAITDGTYARYTPLEIQTGMGNGAPSNGQAVFVKERHTNGAWACLGYPGLMGVFFSNQDESSTVCGWRPIVELVE